MPPTTVPLPLVFVTHEYFPTMGGAATVVAEMAAAAADLGWPVRVLAPGGTPAGGEPGGIPVVRMGHRGRQDWAARAALLRYLRRHHDPGGERLVFADPGATRAALYAPFFGLRFDPAPDVILHGSEILRLSSPWHRRNLFRRCLAGARRIHLLSRANADLLARRMPGLEDRIVVAPGAPSVPPGRSGPPGRGAADPVTVLTVGRIHPRKGQLETLEALGRLPVEDQRRIRYRIAGPVVRRGYRAKILGLAARCPFPVELTGPLSGEELRAEYARADIFALTSRTAGRSVEGFGLVYLDASARGLPVVATRIGGVPEAVIDGRTGLLASENDPAGLTECFRRLIRDPALRERLGRGGREHAASHSWRRTAEAVFGRCGEA
ncbi:MAG: glycosyltransferase family 4 protein [Puniceicoccaceae bacterium]